MIRVIAVDNERLREELKALLPERRFFVTGAATADKALSASGVLKPDLMVLGRPGPGMSMSEFTMAVRRSAALRDVRLLLLAASDSEAAAFRAAGGDEHVPRHGGGAALAAAVFRMVPPEPQTTPQVRVQVLVTVDVNRAGGARGKVFANTVSIAAGGVVLECAEILPLKSEVTLGCFLPGCPERIALRAIVDNALKGDSLHYVLRFLETPGTSRQLFSNWLAARLRSQAQEPG